VKFRVFVPWWRKILEIMNMDNILAIAFLVGAFLIFWDRRKNKRKSENSNQ